MIETGSQNPDYDHFKFTQATTRAGDEQGPKLRNIKLELRNVTTVNQIDFHWSQHVEWSHGNQRQLIDGENKFEFWENERKATISF